MGEDKARWMSDYSILVDCMNMALSNGGLKVSECLVNYSSVYCYLFVLCIDTNCFGGRLERSDGGSRFLFLFLFFH